MTDQDQIDLLIEEVVDLQQTIIYLADRLEELECKRTEESHPDFMRYL